MDLSKYPIKLKYKTHSNVVCEAFERLGVIPECLLSPPDGDHR